MKSAEKTRYRSPPAVMFISGLVIVGIVLAGLLVGNEPDPIPPERSQRELSEPSAVSDAFSESGDPDSLAGNPIVADNPQQFRAEAATVEESPSRTPDPGPDGFPTAIEFFAHVAAEHNLDDADMASELLTWRHFCGKARTPNGTLYPGYDSAEAQSVIKGFEAYCSGLDQAADLAGAENLARNIDSFLSETPPSSRFDDLEVLAPDRALDLLFDDLETALERFSAPGTQVAVMRLLSVDLYPGVEPHGVNSEINLLPIAFPTAFTLICQRLGDCRGADHPFVVAYCLETTTGANRLCVQPGNIGEAVYQTLTPVEYGQYLALLDWINAVLAKRRANEES